MRIDYYNKAEKSKNDNSKKPGPQESSQIKEAPWIRNARVPMKNLTVAAGRPATGHYRMKLAIKASSIKTMAAMPEIFFMQLKWMIK